MFLVHLVGIIQMVDVRNFLCYTINVPSPCWVHPVHLGMLLDGLGLFLELIGSSRKIHLVHRGRNTEAGTSSTLRQVHLVQQGRHTKSGTPGTLRQLHLVH